jgi:acetyl-CoA carboxylase carboxyl transferase subunit alpha
MWRDASKRAQAAAALKATAPDLKQLGCIDDIVPEPGEGAHEDAAEASRLLAEKLRWHLNEVKALPMEDLLAQRYEKFRNIAQFYTSE